MYVYVVLYRESFNAVYDEDNFKQFYKQYADEGGKFWNPLIDVIRAELNNNGDDSDNSNFIFLKDMQ